VLAIICQNWGCICFGCVVSSYRYYVIVRDGLRWLSWKVSKPKSGGSFFSMKLTRFMVLDVFKKPYIGALGLFISQIFLLVSGSKI